MPAGLIGMPSGLVKGSGRCRCAETRRLRKGQRPSAPILPGLEPFTLILCFYETVFPGRTPYPYSDKAFWLTKPEGDVNFLKHLLKRIMERRRVCLIYWRSQTITLRRKS